MLTHSGPLDAGDEQEECERCDGKGYVILWPGEVDQDTEECEDCNGVGYVDVKPITYEDYVEKYGP